MTDPREMQTAGCPKCGAWPNMVGPLFSPHYEAGADCLIWTCRHCGYKVITAPMDRAPDEAPRSWTHPSLGEASLRGTAS